MHRAQLTVLFGLPLAFIGLSPVPWAAAHLGHRGSLDSYSDNWSGYEVYGNTDAFTSVAATFTLPAVTCTGDGDASFWVGLDGAGNDTVEQIGASSDCSGTTPVYEAWWEMFPGGAVLTGGAIAPGDVFNAKVTYDGSGNYTLYLQDETEGWTSNQTETNSSAPDDTAEVICESAGDTSDPVPQFDPVTMSGSRVNRRYLGSESPTAVDLSRNGDTLVTPGAIDSSGDFAFTWQAAS
jgi:hypothetical protein